MNAYTITNYSKRKAKALKVIIKPSTRKDKKIDVFKQMKGKIVKVASIGTLGMNDYPTYLKTKGKKYADKRRRAYKARHAKNIKNVGTPGYYANKILW